MAGYQHGTSTGYALRQEIARLAAQNEQLAEELSKERARKSPDQQMMDAAKVSAKKFRQDAKNALARAKRAASKGESIIEAARMEAEAIIRAAEKQATVIQEVAYDKGWALSDRDYMDSKVRLLDEKRAKQSTLNHYRRTA